MHQIRQAGLRGFIALGVLTLVAVLPGCDAPTPGTPLPGEDETRPFSAIGEAEQLSFTFGEPLWGGEVIGEQLRYMTPERPEGAQLEIRRFAGRGGLSFAGVLDQQSFDMMVTPGQCSTGSNAADSNAAGSERTYPYVVTLSVGGELHEGCGWSDARPYTGPDT